MSLLEWIMKRSDIMKIIAMLTMLLFASAAYAENWVKYCSNNLVDAYYDREKKINNTVVVKWLYKSTPDSGTDQFYRIFVFKAYCSTKQLFNITKYDAVQEVNVYPDTVYESTWRVICGLE